MSTNNTSIPWNGSEPPIASPGISRPLWQSAVIGTVLAAIILATVVGNLLVILSFLTVKSLRRTVSNYYLFNLAIADFIVGFFSMPADTSRILLGHWPYGEVGCKIWTILDYSATIESTFVICFITVDRYWLVTNALRYRLQSKKRPIIGCCISWAVALVFYSVIFTCFDKFTGITVTTDYRKTCQPMVINNLTYNAILIFFEFLIPFAIVVGLNSLIYIKIKRRNQLIKKKPFFFAFPKNASGIGKRKGEETNRMNFTVRRENIPASSSAPSQESYGSYPTDMKNPGNDMDTNCATTKKRTISSTMAKDTHSKTARTLAILCIVYFICWGPYQLVLLLNILCKSCYNSTLWTILTYALWCNSLINPVLYALCSTRFRAAFHKTLCYIFCRPLKARSLNENFNSIITAADAGTLRKDVTTANNHNEANKKTIKYVGLTSKHFKITEEHNEDERSFCSQPNNSEERTSKSQEPQSLENLLKQSKETFV